MNVTDLLLFGVTVHEATSLKFPERGLVLVTGPNGGGKSSIIEGVAFGGWGETLRGTPPWAEDVGSIAMTTSEVDVVRTRKKGRTALEWAIRAAPVGSGAEGSLATDTVQRLQEPVKYETPTKAQAALEAILGPFNVWRRSRVFSSHDAAHFTLATDRERKLLLETILGLEKFDFALKSCRTDLKQALEVEASSRGDWQEAKVRLEANQGRLSDVQTCLAALPAAATFADKAKLEELEKLTKTISRNVQALRDRISAAGRAVALHEGVLIEIERRLKALSAAACPTCEQPIPKELVAGLKVRADGERAAKDQEKAEAAVQVADAREELAELESEAEKIQRRGANLAADARENTRNESERTRLKAAVDRTSEAVNKLAGELAALETRNAAAVKELLELMAAERVLGLRGVRAQMLGRALAGLETVANAWLTRIVRAGFHVKLPTDDDKIGLEITGAGGGHGYKAASGGERRRIDIALVLALAEVANAAGGRDSGTLFFDEVFDALDEEGVERVIGALCELAERRCVCVITHNSVLAAKIPAVQHWHVVDGKVRGCATEETAA